MDWTRTDHEWVVDVTVVSQHALESTMGKLRGVVESSCSITEGYYTDTRVSAKVATVVPEGESDGYVEYARLRIILSVPSQGWSKELFTGYVTDVGETRERGAIRREYSIDSTLWGISQDLLPYAVNVGKGAKLVSTWKKLLDKASKPYSTAGAQDRTWAKTQTFEVGSSIMSVLFDLCGSASRMDVDGHGRITLTKYVAPSQRTASKLIDEDDPRTLVLGELGRTSAEWERPGRAIVTASVSRKKGNTTVQETIAGSYDAPKSHATSSSRRGYMRARIDSYKGGEKEPKKDTLADEAKKNWQNSQDSGIEWDVTVLYMGLHAGDIVTLSPRGERPRKTLVKSCETSLDPTSPTQKLTLKEV